MKQCKLMIVVVCSLLVGCRQAAQVEGIPFSCSVSEGWGILDAEGEVAVSAGTYPKSPSPVVNGRYTVPLADGTVQLYDLSHPGQPLSLRKFVRVGYFFDKVTIAQEQEDAPLLLVDRSGQTVSVLDYPLVDDIVKAHNFSDGRALVMTAQGKYGYVDTQGKLVVPPIYSEAYDFSEGKALVGMRDRYGKTGYQVIDTDGNVLFVLQYSEALYTNSFSEGKLLSYSQTVRQWSYLDDEGHSRLFLPDTVYGAFPFRKGTAVFAAKGGYGMIDGEGKALLPAAYRDVRIVTDGRAAVSVAGKWDLYDWEKRRFIPLGLDTIPIFLPSGWGIARVQGMYFCIDSDGRKINQKLYSGLSADEEVLWIKPQVFVRRTLSPDVVPVLQPVEHPAKSSAVTAVESKPDSPKVQIEATDWKNVTRSHPFYEEAVKMLSGGLEEDDASSRRMILDYVEHLRTSYITRDIDFLNQLFSEDALIIVGTVVYSLPQEEDGRIFRNQVKYSVKSKEEYLDRLREVFRRNSEINLQFSDFRIMRHPSASGIYGVTLHQKYRSDSYSDDGYLFLLWDFRDSTAPKIHVRTWQPGMRDGMTPLPESQIISINQFNLN